MNSVGFCSERPSIVLPLICSADSSEVVNGEDVTFKGASDHFCRFSLCAYLKPRGLCELRETNREALFPPSCFVHVNLPHLFSFFVVGAKLSVCTLHWSPPPPDPSSSFPSGGLISPVSCAHSQTKNIRGANKLVHNKSSLLFTAVLYSDSFHYSEEVVY